MPPKDAPSALPSASILAFDPGRTRPGLLARLDQMRVEISRVLSAGEGIDCDPRVAPARIAELLENAHAAFFENIDDCAQISIDISILSVYAIHNGAWGSKGLLPDLMKLQETAVSLSEADMAGGKHIVLA